VLLLLLAASQARAQEREAPLRAPRRAAFTAEYGLTLHGGAGGEGYGLAVGIAARDRQANDQGLFARMDVLLLAHAEGLGDGDVDVLVLDFGYRWGVFLAGDATSLAALTIGGAIGACISFGFDKTDQSLDQAGLGAVTFGEIELRVGPVLVALVSDARALVAIADPPVELMGSVLLRAGIELAL